MGLLLGIIASILTLTSLIGHQAAPNPPRVKVEFRLCQKTPSKGLAEATVRYGQSAEETVYLHKEALITNADVVEAHVVQAKYNPKIFQVELVLTRKAANRLAEASVRHKGERLAELIDGKVVSVGLIIGKISGPIYISGEFTKEEAERIANGLNRK